MAPARSSENGRPHGRIPRRRNRAGASAEGRNQTRGRRV